MIHNFNERYIAARRAVIARRYGYLNPMQREAVLTTEGPLLLLAGAGSGKTTVLINRVDNLLTFGKGSDTDFVPEWATAEDLAFLEGFPEQPSPEEWREAHHLCAVEPAHPWSVIAITFTNKAAGELKERLARMCGPGANDIWAATFHSACVRILRRDIDRLGEGFNTNFTIYDSDDSKRVIKDVLKDLSLEEKEFPPRSVLAIISGAKDRDQSHEEFAREAASAYDWRMPRIARIYEEYDRRLHAANALDFDDIILHAVHLLVKDEEVRTYYQKKFRYVLVDEYQDTNHLQYMLARLLAGGRENICVVGDDDQSIYRFRGANIENILNFEKQYASCRTIRLEQNYRSTQNILDAANAVIRNNVGRKGKTLWTESGPGDKVLIKTVYNENDEATFVAGKIMEYYGQGGNWRDNAVLYRTNAQSNAMEMAFKRNGIPYKVYGGLKFFDRAEVKDMLAYLCVINNPADDLRLRRIVNTPVRGIGNTTMDRVQHAAELEGTSLYQIMKEAGRFPEFKSAAAKLSSFAGMIDDLREREGDMELPGFYNLVCEKTNYIAALQAKDDMESRGRIENVQELRSSIIGFLESDPEDRSLAGFLDTVALFTDLDETAPDDNCVSMMTMHSAKGLEFPSVFVVGMEEGLFPGGRAAGESEEMEEERRLCYVAMTRARERLTMTTARQRMLYGRTTSNKPSRFLEEVPEGNSEWLSRADRYVRRDDWDTGGFGGSSFGGGGFYETPRPSVRTFERPASRESSYSAQKAVPPISLALGDTVKHRSFGRGLVLSVRPMGGDALVEIAFDDVGTKKLMLKAAAAHLEKI